MHTSGLRSDTYLVNCLQNIENNWRSGKFVLHKINCHSENSRGVYCLQYDDDRIVSGLRDNTIKVRPLLLYVCVRVLGVTRGAFGT